MNYLATSYTNNPSAASGWGVNENTYIDHEANKLIILGIMSTDLGAKNGQGRTYCEVALDLKIVFLWYLFLAQINPLWLK